MKCLSEMNSKDINILFGKLEKITPIKCTEVCEYYKFPLDIACILSGVYSVSKGELGYNYEVNDEKRNME